MNIYAWTLTWKKLKAKNKKGFAYKLTDYFPKMNHDKDHPIFAWTNTHSIIPAMCRGRNIMGFVVIENDYGQTAVSMCSIHERKFSLRRGIEIAKGRLERKVLAEEEAVNFECDKCGHINLLKSNFAAYYCEKCNEFICSYAWENDVR